MTDSEHKKYTKSFKEIQALFSDEDSYRAVFQYFYNDGSDSKQLEKKADELEKVRQDILATTKTLLGQETYSDELIDHLKNSIQSIRDGSLVKRTKTIISKENEKQYQKGVASLVKSIDTFSTKIFRYNSQNAATFALELLKEEDKKAFAKLTAYSALAKKKLKKIDEYTKKQQECITSVLGSIPNVEDYTWEEISKNLKSSYDDIREIDYVKTAAKTNHLKASGRHSSAFIKASSFITVAITIVAGYVAFNSAPGLGASLPAILRFIGTQVVPNCLQAAAIASAPPAAIIAFNTLSFRNVKKSIKAMDVQKREKLFELVQETIKMPKKTRVAEFEKLCKANDIQINLGSKLKGRNLSYLIHAQETVNKYGIDYLLDMRRNHNKFTKVTKKLSRIVANNPQRTDEYTNNLEARISRNYYKGSILSEILGISGSKGSKTTKAFARKKNVEATPTIDNNGQQTTVVDQINTSQVTINQPTTSDSPSLDKETIRRISSTLSDKSIREKQIKFKINDQEFNITMKKIHSIVSQKDCKKCLAKIEEQVKDMLTYGADGQTQLRPLGGKVDLTIAPPTKKN